MKAYKEKKRPPAEVEVSTGGLHNHNLKNQGVIMQSPLYTKIALIVKNLSTFSEVSYNNFNRKKFRKLLKKNKLNINVRIASSTFWEINYDCNDDVIEGNVQLNLLMDFTHKDESTERTTPINKTIIGAKKIETVLTDLDYEIYKIMLTFKE